MKRETLNLVVSPDIMANLGGPNLLKKTQATRAMTLMTSDGLLLRGHRQHRATHGEGERTRRAIHDLGIELNDVEYASATVKRSLAKVGWSGMEAGIAMKSGNADGVKASTVSRSWMDKHLLHAAVEARWQET